MHGISILPILSDKAGSPSIWNLYASGCKQESFPLDFQALIESFLVEMSVA